MMISWSCVLFSNWNWLVCSSSILNVYTIWAVRGFLFPVNLCVEWCCRILYLLKSVLLWSFPWGLYIWLKTIANKVSDAHNLKILSVFIVLVLFFGFIFLFWGRRRNETSIFGYRQVFILLHGFHCMQYVSLKIYML